MSDVFQRIGRGGAGNYISQKDIEEAEKAQRANDPESQIDADPTAAAAAAAAATSPPPPASAPASHPPPQYIRAGRGGAGNYSEPPTIADSQDRQEVVERTAAAVSASQAGRPRVGLTGRGGAGNWTGGDATAEAGENGTNGDGPEDKERRQQIADRIRNDIDASLPPPPKTYHQHDRDME